MTGFRVFLVAIFLTLIAFTGVVIANHGWGLFTVFFGDILKMGWAGQFNLDFMFMLALSALWVAWRHDFSGTGIALGVLALFGGASFQTVYLLIVSLQEKGDMQAILLGPSRSYKTNSTPRDAAHLSTANSCA